MIRLILAIALSPFAIPATGQQTPVTTPAAAFTFEEVMIPMRDGARLQTVIIRPVGQSGPLPILLQRTPYGLPAAAPSKAPANWASLVEDGYIFVFQSMRGRFKSDGKFTFSTAVHKDPKIVDEATDAYDTVDWLVKNAKPNNGKVGMWGVSYPGFAAAVALARPHPALRAVSPQAAWNDYWLNDDLHRNGALRLSYATDWLYSQQADKMSNKDIAYDTIDTYAWFLRQGPVENIDRDVLKGASPMFTSLLDHPNHESFYTDQRWTDALGKTTVPTLNVAGFWDQEDPLGSWNIYARQQANDPNNLSTMVAGPWAHGGWQGDTSKLGRLPLGGTSGADFRDQIQAPFFRYWLHGKGVRPNFEARMFQSGSNVWKSLRCLAPERGDRHRALSSGRRHPLVHRPHRRGVPRLRLRSGEPRTVPPAPDLADLSAPRMAVVGGGRPALRRWPARRA